MKLLKLGLISTAYAQSSERPEISEISRVPSPEEYAGNLPAGAVQCPIEHPFSKYGANSQTVESCCKCPSLTKCKAAAGANHYNIGGANAMFQANDVVDKSGLMCGKECSDTEECRYDNGNCEYKCYATSTTICDTDLCNQKGSSVAAKLSMALVFAIYSFSD